MCVCVCVWGSLSSLSAQKPFNTLLYIYIYILYIYACVCVCVCVCVCYLSHNSKFHEIDRQCIRCFWELSSFDDRFNKIWFCEMSDILFFYLLGWVRSFAIFSCVLFCGAYILWQNYFEKRLDVFGSIVVLGALTRFALLPSVCNLKAIQINDILLGQPGT